jgi:hypothetical protein
MFDIVTAVQDVVDEGDIDGTTRDASRRNANVA